MQKLHKVKSAGKHAYYIFKCGCGRNVERRGDCKAKSCGLTGCTTSTRRSHGKSDTRLYMIWCGIRDRALTGNHKSSRTYKERGIGICPEWTEFVVFETWALANGYEDHLTIDRININEGYHPNNCEWVTRAENTRRQNHDGHGHQKQILLINGFEQLEFLSIAEAARYISKFTPTKFRSICTAVENRIKDNNPKPYKGFVCVGKEGIRL